MLPPDQMMNSQVQVTLDQPDAGVIMQAEIRDDLGEQELWVTIIVQNKTDIDQQNWSQTPVWGAAAHLFYPADRLEFLLMKEAPGRQIAAVNGDLPGRIFWYHGNLVLDENREQANLITLRFRVLRPADQSSFRLEVPRRFASVRGRENQRLNYNWSAASIQISGGMP